VPAISTPESIELIAVRGGYFSVAGSVWVRTSGTVEWRPQPDERAESNVFRVSEKPGYTEAESE